MPRKRSTANALKRLFATSSQPVYVLDEQRHVVFCNAAFADWLDVREEDVLDQRCDYHAHPVETPVQEALASLCPAPEVFAGEQQNRILCVRLGEGVSEDRQVTFLPLCGEDNVVGVICLVRVGKIEHDASSDVEIHRHLSRFRSQYAQHYRLEQLLGESPSMQRVRNQVAAAVTGHCRVLISGAKGSGREHVARTIHYGDDIDSAPPLLPIACPLFDAELLQATVTSFASRVREVDSLVSFGLLLFDVDELAEDAQHELLGLLTLPRINIRPIATSTRPAGELLHDATMSSALIQALSTIEIHLPALSSRPEDIPYLAQHFLEASNVGPTKQLSGFTPDALTRLATYTWPMNLDDLAAAVNEACRRADGPLVAKSDLPEHLEYAAQANALPRLEEESIVLDDLLNEVECEVLRRALVAAKGNKAQAARSLGISRARLHRRVEYFGLQ